MVYSYVQQMLVKLQSFVITNVKYSTVHISKVQSLSYVRHFYDISIYEHTHSNYAIFFQIKEMWPHMTESQTNKSVI